MAKSPLNQKKRQQKLRQEIKELDRAAFIKSNYPSDDYDNSVEEKIAQEKLEKAKNKLYKLEKSKEKKANKKPFSG